MTTSSRLAFGQRIDALNLKIESLQREMSELRRDVRRILWLMEHGKTTPRENEETAAP